MLDGYYSIGEVAHLTGLSVKAIRHYANENLVAPSALSDVGYRLYNPEDVWRLSLVRLLRELEFSLPQIQKILVRSPDVASVLQWQKNVLDLQIEHLTNVRSRIDQIPADTWGTSSLAHLQIDQTRLLSARGFGARYPGKTTSVALFTIEDYRGYLRFLNNSREQLIAPR